MPVDIPTDFSAPEYSDINSITGALKLYFRELPNPLIPFEFFADFMIAISTIKLLFVCVCVCIDSAAL